MFCRRRSFTPLSDTPSQAEAIVEICLESCLMASRTGDLKRRTQELTFFSVKRVLRSSY